MKITLKHPQGGTIEVEARDLVDRTIQTNQILFARRLAKMQGYLNERETRVVDTETNVTLAQVVASIPGFGDVIADIPSPDGSILDDYGNVRVHELRETDELGNSRRLGGTITELPTHAALGQLDALSIEPNTKEGIQHEFWYDQYVKIQLADRLVWLNPEQVLAVIKLLATALSAAQENVDDVM